MEKNLVIGQNPRSLKSRWDLDPKNQEQGIYACIYIHIYICTYIHTDMYAYTYAPCSRLRDGEGGLEARCENACVVQEVLQYVLQCVLSFAFCASVGGETRDQSNLSFSMSVFYVLQCMLQCVAVSNGACACSSGSTCMCVAVCVAMRGAVCVAVCCSVKRCMCLLFPTLPVRVYHYVLQYMLQ